MDKLTKTGFTLTGIRLDGKTTNANGQSGIDCGNLWQKFEKEKYPERIPGKLGDEIYAVYFEYEGDHQKPFSYFIGCRVPTDAPAPAGMTNIHITAGSFTKVVAKGKMPDCVANSWKDIHHAPIDRNFSYDFEVYDERSKDWNDAEVEIFVSV